MIKKQTDYLNYLNELGKQIEDIELSNNVKETLNILKTAIEKAELIIPVIGAFSSGKSSLINSFLGKEILPVGITPETAIATELRYTEPDSERIEAVKNEDDYDIFPIEEISNIGKNASNYKYIRLFLANNRLKEIQPLILADMPGFESPFDLHNRAIMEYINKGVKYIILISIEEGTITRSMSRKLRDIQQYRRGFSFFLSKTNLRSPEEVESVKRYLEEQIFELFDIKQSIVAIDENGGENLKSVLSKVDVNKIFESLFIDDLKDHFNNIVDNINTIINSLKKSINQNEKEINGLEKVLNTIIAERNSLIEEVREKYSSISINKIVENVGRELTNSLDELVTAAKNGGKDALSSTISDIVRSSLILNMNKTMSAIGSEIISTFSMNLSELAKSNTDFAITPELIDKISKSSKILIERTQSGLQKIFEKTNGSTKLYKTVTTVLAVTTNIVGPILEVIIIFLPDIINLIMRNYQNKKQEENIRNAILINIIPSVKRKLREQLPGIFNKEVEELINQISAQFEYKIVNKKETIEKTKSEIRKNITSIAKTVDLYESKLKSIEALAINLLYY